MPSTPEDRLFGITTSVAVKPAVSISADYNITLFGEQTITSSTTTGERTITTVSGMRVLAMGQDSSVDNGIWIAGPATWRRAPDFDGARDAVNGTLVFNVYGDAWQVEGGDDTGRISIGYDEINFRTTYLDSAVSAIFQRSIRVSEPYVDPLPPLSSLEGMVIAIIDGKPVGIKPETGTTTDALIQLAAQTGAGLVNTLYNGSVQEVMGLSPYKRVGNIGSGVEMENATDAVKYNGMYYIYKGTLPHTTSESAPDSNYRCVGLLNGWPITHTRNWGVASDGTDQTASMQLMIASLPANSVITSDMEPIYIADLQLTTDYPSMKFKGIRFAPYFASGTTALAKMFTCTRSGLVFEDVTIDKPATGSSITAVFHMTDTLNCRFTRITCTGTAGTIGTFWKLYRVKESSWDNLRIDLDSSGYTGTLFESNYSVNNTINGGFVGFGLNFIRFTTTADPTYGNRSEGWYINNVVGVFFQLPINGLTVTACHVNNCQFDFCLTRFFEFTNGGYSSINNCWFANHSSTTSTSHAVVAGGTYTGIVITNNTFINNTGDNTRSLFSLNPSANYGARVTNNISSNFSLGVVLGVASQCFGNVFVGEGTVTSTNNAITRVRGLGLDLTTKPTTWTANANAAYLSFTNQYGTAYIRSVNGSSSDRIGLSFNTLYDGNETQVMYLSDYTIRLPHLPADTSGAGINGLYAGADGIVRINR